MHVILCTLAWVVLAAEPAVPNVTYFGIAADLLRSSKDSGLKVMRVLATSPADKAGLAEEDIILKFDELAVGPWDEFDAHIKGCKPGTKHAISILREGKRIELTVALTERSCIADLVQEDPPRVDGGAIVGAVTMKVELFNVATGNFVMKGTTSLVTGDYVQGDWGLMGAELESPNKSAVEVKGNVTLAGILYVRTNGFTAKAGDRFEIILGARSLKGRFAKTILPKLPAGLAWQVVYDDVPAGRDLNADGKHDVTLLVVREPQP